MLNEFVKQDARPLPVILLLDVSGSMDGYKIEALNNSVREMIRSFANDESTRAEIHVAIITFGGEVKLHTDLMPSKNIVWSNLTATGYTPLGHALDQAKIIIEDKSKIPSRSYRPCVVLVSDGMPNDEWEAKLNSFINEGRSSKCDRWALGIGNDVDLDILKKFLNDSEKRVFQAEDAAGIKKFFRYVTISTTTRSKSLDPNKIINDFKNYDPFANDSIEF